MSFTTLKAAVLARHVQLSATGPLFTVATDRDDIWNTYIDSFPEELRQEHNCNCCKAFLRQAGNIVGIDPQGHLLTLWDLDPDEVPAEYREAVTMLRAYVLSCPVNGLFFHENTIAGTDKSPDKKRGIVWEHFMVPVPPALRDSTGRLARESAKLAETAAMLARAIAEIGLESIDTVLELVAQNSLYRGQDYKHLLDGFRKLLVQVDTTESHNLANWLWLQAKTLPETVSRIRNTAIGTLLVDLNEGKSLEAAVGAFERIVAPTNYKRPTALVTGKMVEKAKERLQELGLISALERRRLDTRDLTAAHALYVHRPQAKAQDVFAELAGKAPVDPKTLTKVEEIKIENFIEKVLPSAKSLRVLMERQHLGNLVTLTGAVDPEAKSLMKWDNSFAWSYSGGIADSIKERVKAAGGRVDCWLRISLAWHNHDDLDLHFHGPNNHIWYGNKRAPSLQAALDVDMNAGSGQTREPVENVHINEPLPPSNYYIRVHQFARRENRDDGYEVEIEHNGEIINLHSPKSPKDRTFGPGIAFKVTRDGQVILADNGLSRTSTGVVKWGLKTGVWHTVRSLTLSPNHWTRPTGNKHWFFLLEGCVSDEPTRPFLNEFLCAELDAERKVMEVLGSKVRVADAEGAELSGLGFSETLRNHLFVEVESTFKRILKIVF